MLPPGAPSKSNKLGTWPALQELVNKERSWIHWIPSLGNLEKHKKLSCANLLMRLRPRFLSFSGTVPALSLVGDCSLQNTQNETILCANLVAIITSLLTSSGAESVPQFVIPQPLGKWRGWRLVKPLGIVSLLPHAACEHKQHEPTNQNQDLLLILWAAIDCPQVAKCRPTSYAARFARISPF